MTTTLTHPDTVTEEIATNTLPPLREGGTVEEALRLDRVVASPQPHTGDGGTVTRATPSGEGPDEPQRPLHQAASLHPKPQSPDPKPDLLNRLLTLYTTHSNSLSDLCRELDLSMLELLDLLEHPEVTRALERLALASESRAKLLARVASDSAISALIDLMDTTDKPETRRKAAGALLRHSKTPAKSSKRATDKLPLPHRGVGEGPGEGHQLRTSSRPHATDSDAAPAEKSVPPRHEWRGQRLDRHPPVQPRIPREMHLSHAAAAEFVLNPE